MKTKSFFDVVSSPTSLSFFKEHRRATMILLSGLLLSQPAQSQNWTGTLDGDWNKAGNWSTTTVPTNAQVATFNSNPTNPVVTLGANQTVDGLSFTAGASTGIQLGTFNDYVLTLDGGAATDINIASGSGAHTIHSALLLTGTHSWANASNNAFTAGGNVTFGTTALTLSNAGSGGWVFGSASSILLNNNAGDVTLNVGNTGAATDLTLNGTFYITNSTSGRTLRIAPAAGSVVDINAVLANGDGINGTGGSALVVGQTTGNTGTVNLNATKTYTGTTTINAGATLNVNAVITNGGNWDIDGGVLNWNVTNTTMGPLYLGGGAAGSTSITNIATGVIMNLGNNIYTEHSTSNSGIAEINGGTIQLNATRVIEVRPSTAVTNELTINSVIADGAASAGVTKTRNGTLILTADNTFTGASAVNEGSLVLDHRSNNGDKLSATQIFSMAGGTLELWGNATEASSQSFTGITLSGMGANRIRFTPSGGQQVSIQTGNILRANNLGATLSVELLSSEASLATTSANTNGILGGWASVKTSSGDYFARTEGGKITALATENYAAANHQIENQLGKWQTGANISDEGGWSGTHNNIDVNSLRVSGSNALQVLDMITVRSGGILVSETSTSSGIFGGTLGVPATANNYELVFMQNSSTDFEISSNIQRHNNGLGAYADLTKSGTGTLILSGRNNTGPVTTGLNSASGTVRINEGVLAVSGGKAISDQSTVNLDARAGVFFRLLSDETIGTLLGGGADGGTVDLGSNRLTVNQASSQTFNGYLVGSGTLVKQNLGPAGTTQGNLQMNGIAYTQFTGSVLVNGGLFYMSGNNIANFQKAASFTVNKGGALMIDNNSSSSGAGDRIGNTAPITLNGANGTFAGQLAFRGLVVRSDQNSTRDETFGRLTFNSGANYVTLETTNTGPSSIASLTSSEFVRNNQSTVTLRGTNLGATTSMPRGVLKLVNSTADNAFIAAHMVGGTGAIDSTTLKILTWGIGQDFGSTAMATATNLQLGNSLVTYASGTGFRALKLTGTEYSSFANANTLGTSNVRESLNASDLTGLASANLNALVLDNASTSAARSVIGAGADTSLNLSSGVMLFTALDANLNAQATGQGLTLGGFDAGITTSTGEYVVFQNNLSAAGVTIASNLTSVAKLTKSGLGTLVLTGDNSTLTDVTLNEGTVQISNLAQIGGNDGALIFAGGTLKLSAGFTSDLSSKAITVLGSAENLGANGGRMGVLDTNGVNTVFNQNLQGAGEFVKTGIGTLTLKATTESTFTGNIVVEQTRSGAITPTVPQLILDNSGGNAIAGNLQIGAYLNPTVNGSATVQLARSNQIIDSAVISFNGAGERYSYFSMLGFDETVAGIQDISANGLVQVDQSGGTVNGSTLTLGGADDYYFNGFVRNRSGGTGGLLSVVHQGSGSQTFAGDNIRYSGATTNSQGVLRYRDAVNFDGNIENHARLEFERTSTGTNSWNYSGVISGSGDFHKLGESAQVTTLDANNTLTGAVVVQAGKLALGTNGKIDNAKMLEVRSGATFETAVAGYTYFGKVSGTGTLVGNLTLSKSGGTPSLAALLPGASSELSNANSAGNLLGNLNVSGTLTLTGGSAVGDELGAKAILQVSKATFNDAAGFLTALGNGSLSSYLNSQAGASWNALSTIDALTGETLHDTVTFTTGNLVWNAGSTLRVEAVDGYSAAYGDVIDLFDWDSAFTGTASDGSTLQRRGGGLIDDLYLPTLGAGLEYDLSAFQSHGLIAVVPEPSKAMTLFAALGLLASRRRRK